MRFKNKVAMISGGGSGMGKASALAFASEGAIVAIIDINEEDLNNTADSIRAIEGTVAAFHSDVTKSENIKAVVKKTLDLFGRIDILFNHVGGNPGYKPPSLFITQSEDFVDKTIELNLKSTMILTRAVLDSMIQHNYGKVINMGAAAGRVGAEGMVGYSTAKGGVIAFTKALAREVALHNININCICPGPIETPGSAKFAGKVDRAKRENANNNIPLKRVGTSEEIASAVLYLASDDASYITGQVLSIDGGMTMI